MHTRADIQVSVNDAVLEINRKRMKAVIESPANASFEVISANVPLPQGQQPDVRNLIFNLSVPVGTTQIKVVFGPA